MLNKYTSIIGCNNNAINAKAKIIVMSNYIYDSENLEYLLNVEKT